MTPQGGGEELRDLLRAHGEEAIQAEAESAGLAPLRHRFKCPRPPCAGKADRQRNAGWFAAEGGIYKWKCHSCDDGGTLIDLLINTRGWSVAEALTHLRGQQTPLPRPQLRVVAAPATSPDKLPTAEVKRLWDAMDRIDSHGQAYLNGRGLDGGSLVRFATEKHPDGRVKSQSRAQRRIAMLLSDVVGNPRSIQFRLAREPQSKEPKILSLKGASSSGAFFGRPELVEGAQVVCVTEGLADTIAVADWCEAKAPVVGAPGKNQLPRLAESLREHSIAVSGKVFALFVQNDRPKNESRREFVRLSQLLAEGGAHPVIVVVPDEFKDVADWRRAQPDAQWPPLELAKALGDETEHETMASELVRPDGSAVAIPKLFATDRYGQDFTTLLALLDDSVHREAIMGRGELQLNEMSERPLYDGRELKDSDVAAIRYGLEQQGRATEGKPLKFSMEDVHMALKLLSSRKRVHPVREWLKSLQWDRKERIGTELPNALGIPLDSLEAHLVRRWLISAVARAMVPGCKVDTVLVLVGAQGAGKSSFFAAIGGEWFSDEKVNVDDKDGKLTMRQAWIIEWAELDAMRRARDQESIKAFLSQRVDRFRPPYGRDIIEAPRHCVIVGTTNNQEFLSDPTGSRRFWPIRTDNIDADWVRTHRAQLLAEAVFYYLAGEKWWLDSEHEQVLAERNKNYETRDAWQQLVADWIEREPLMSFVTTDMVLAQAVEKKKELWEHKDKMRAGTIMRRLGWTEAKRRVGKSVLHGYVNPVSNGLFEADRWAK